MANSRLSFSIAVKLLTANFQSGATTVKTQLRSMQIQAMSFVAALGTGTIGLGNFISKLVETAKETSRVNIALKNVSGSAADYLSNQKWLIDLSKKYGVNINSLTSGYTKFKAAADISNMSLLDQRKIFESVSRASVAFGLSGEDQKGVFLALAQMMSKNKVMAEELRLQMAERLPVAIQAMAKAAGVSVGELDNLMKQGKVLAADVLPRFAEALNEMIPNVDTNNLNKSLSDLGNTFIEFTKNMNVEGIFKSLVERATGALNFLASHSRLVFTAIQAAIAFTFGSVVKSALASMITRYDAAVTSAVKMNERAAKAAERTEAAQKARDAAGVAHTEAVEAQKKLTVEASEAQKQAAHLATHNAKRTLDKKELALTRAVEAQKRAEMSVTGGVAAMAAKKGQTAWARFGSAGWLAIKKLGTAIKSLAVSSLITGLIGGALWLIEKLGRKLYDVYRVSKIVKEASARAEEPVVNSTVTQIEAYRKILDDTKAKESTRRGALEEINKLLGTQYEYGKLFTGELGGQKKELDSLNSKINDQIKLLSLRDRAVKYQTEADNANAEIGRIKSDPEFAEKQDKFNNRKQSDTHFYRFKAAEAAKAANSYKENPDKMFAEQLAAYFGGQESAFLKKAKEAEQSKYTTKELDAQQIVADMATGMLTNVSSEIAKLVGDSVSTSNLDTDKPDGDKPPKSELQKQEAEYLASLKELHTKRDLGIISAEDYTDAERKLVEQMYLKAKISGNEVIPETSPYYQTLQTEYGKSSHGDALKAEQEYAVLLKKYNEGVKEQMRLLDAGEITYEEYRDAMFDLAKELRRQLIVQGLDNQGNLKFQLNSDIRQNAPEAKVKTYDASRDYKKTDMDILSGQLDVAKENAESVRALCEKNADLYTDQLNKELMNVESLEDALKIAEAKEAVQNLSKEIRQGLYEGTKNIVSNVDGIVSSFERVGDVLDDSDASAWEKMMAVWQAMISIGDAISQTADFIEKMAMAKDMLAKAENAQAAASTASTAVNAANAAANMATDTAETTSEVTNAATKVGAAQGSAMAKSAESSAGLPFPWNLVAMGTAMAGVMALFDTIPKFAKGGIVGGNSPAGDKILARLNSGEMILNGDQQGTLYGMLNNGGVRNINVTGTFRMRGRDMVAMIDKENRIKERT